MAEPIKFTELTNAGTLDLSAIMAIVQQQGGELVSLQCSMAQVAELVASSAVYADLTTEQKKLIDAINELNAGKQKKLIAGANITINEETGEISSTGGGGGGDVTKAYVDEQNALQDVEITKNKDSLTELEDDIKSRTVNLLDINTVLMNKAISINQSNVAVVVDNSSWNLTDYIPVEELTRYFFKVYDFEASLTNGYRVIGYCFDENKNYINYANDEGTWGEFAFDSNRCKRLSTVANTRYIRVQYQVRLNDYNEIQFSNIFTSEYEPFMTYKFASESYVDETINKTNARYTWYNTNAVRRADFMLSRLLNTAKANKMINTNITSLMESGDVFQHDAVACFHNTTTNMLYVVYVNNKTNTGDNPKYNEAYVRLTPIQCTGAGVISSKLPSIDICKNGDTVEGYTIQSGCGVPNAYFVGDILHIIWCAKANNHWCLMHNTYDVSSSTLGTPNICRMDNQLMTSEQIASHIGLTTSEVISMNASITKLGNYYYACACAENNWKNGVILKTSNFNSWEFVAEPSFLNGIKSDAIYEGAMGTYDNKLYLALRQKKVHETVPLILAKLGSDGVVEDTVLLPSVSSRPTFFERGTTELYLGFSSDNRYTTTLLHINSNIAESVPMQDIPNSGNYLVVAPRTANLQFVVFTAGTTGLRVSSMNGLQRTPSEVMNAFVTSLNI